MDYEITQRQLLPVPRPLVFGACSNKDILSAWCFPGGWSNSTDYELSFIKKQDATPVSEGSRDPCDYQGKLEDDEEYVFTLEVISIHAPEQISFLYNSSLIKDSRITLDLSVLAQGTEIIATQNRLVSQRYADVHLEAWRNNFQLLEKLLASSGYH